MSGFDVGELLPFYLDETDEQIGVLNDGLLQLERDPSDAKALQEVFRIAHSIKGSASVMGFEKVKTLTHFLESYFDQLRSGGRQLDRPALDVCFRCLDTLRDYHRELRSEGQSSVDLTGSIQLVKETLEKPLDPAPSEPQASLPEAADPQPTPPEASRPESVEEPKPSPPETPGEKGPASPPDSDAIETPRPPRAGAETILHEGRDRLGLTVVFETSLQWRDMKARLILNRLASKAKVLGTDPSVDSPDFESQAAFTVWLEHDREMEELRSLANVDGVSEIRLVSDVSPDANSVSEVGSPPSESVAAPGAELRTVTATPAPRTSSAPSTPAAEIHGPGSPTETPAPAGTKRSRVAATLRVDVDRLDHLMNLAGELVINKARFSQIAAAMTELFQGTNTAVLASDAQDRLEGILLGMQTLAATGAVSESVLGRWDSQFRRLRDNLKTVRSQLEQFDRAQEQLGGLREAIDQLNRVTQAMQKGVLETRMVPIGPLFERFRRVIRDLAVNSSKDVELELSGESTELDKRMIDELADPLIHMVRNSVDHGLEPPDERVAAGKPRAGTVTLQASHRGNSIVITVNDDGRGIDAERIRRKVVSHGLLRPEDAEVLEPRQLVPYIFHPGLSTAEQITEVSGRGVGMDIVKSRIEALNGTVDVRSEPNLGTTFTIRLPLTLAILPSLLVKTLDEVYSLPLDAIEEIVEVGPDQVFNIHDRRTIDIRGRIVSLVALDDVFSHAHNGSRSKKQIPKPRESGKIEVVLLNNGETTIGLQVDELIGIQEVVLKSLERHFRSVHGLSGASILGNGRVCLILDIDAVVNLLDPGASRQRGAAHRPAGSRKA